MPSLDERWLATVCTIAFIPRVCRSGGQLGDDHTATGDSNQASVTMEKLITVYLPDNQVCSLFCFNARAYTVLTQHIQAARFRFVTILLFSYFAQDNTIAERNSFSRDQTPCRGVQSIDIDSILVKVRE